jgi:hypothetical protein
MKLKTLSLLFLLPNLLIAQVPDSIKSEIIGSWTIKYLVATEYDKVIDTIITPMENSSGNIRLTESKVQEFYTTKENGLIDTFYISDEERWWFYMRQEKLMIYFGCDGQLICGNWETLKFSNNELLLKGCVHYNDFECEELLLEKN